MKKHDTEVYKQFINFLKQKVNNEIMKICDRLAQEYYLEAFYLNASDSKTDIEIYCYTEAYRTLFKGASDMMNDKDIQREIKNKNKKFLFELISLKNFSAKTFELIRFMYLLEDSPNDAEYYTPIFDKYFYNNPIKEKMPLTIMNVLGYPEMEGQLSFEMISKDEKTLKPFGVLRLYDGDEVYYVHFLFTQNEHNEWTFNHFKRNNFYFETPYHLPKGLYFVDLETEELCVMYIKLAEINELNIKKQLIRITEKIKLEKCYKETLSDYFEKKLRKKYDFNDIDEDLVKYSGYWGINVF